MEGGFANRPRSSSFCPISWEIMEVSAPSEEEEKITTEEAETPELFLTKGSNTDHFMLISSSLRAWNNGPFLALRALRSLRSSFFMPGP